MMCLSKYFLLLDFLYGQSMMDSVTREEGSNISKLISALKVDHRSCEEVVEGRHLCEMVLDRIVDEKWPISIAAGLWFKDLPGQGKAHHSNKKAQFANRRHRR